jgi:tetratricopeptide (TPR) repeat protein
VAAKRPEDAEKLAHEMLNHDPTALGVYDALYVYYARNKRMADAEKVLETKIQKNPKVIDGYMQLARYYYGTQRRDEMMALLKKVSDNPATFPNGSLDVGNFFVSIREFDLATQQFRAGVERAPKNKAEYQRALAETLAKQKKVGEAAAVIADVLKENPKDERAIAMRGALTLLGGSKEHLDSAISDLQSAVRDMPRNPVVRYNLGRAMLAKGDQAQARTQFEESIKLNPTYSPPKLQLAQMLLRAGEYPRTAQLSQEVLAYDPSNAPARLLRGRALIAMGDLTEARRELEQTTAAYPNFSEARLQLAAVDLRDKKFSAAEKAFRDVYQNSEDPRAFIGLVETQIAQNRVPAGLQMLKEEVAKHPDRMEYRIALANVSALTSDYSTAIAEYNKVLERNPKNSQVWLQLAETYRRSGDAGRAVDGLKKTIELAPNDVRPHLQLAVLYDTAGRKSEARPYYDRVLQLDPNNPVALNNLAYMLAESGRDLDQALTMAQRATQQRPNDGDVADTLGLIYIKKNLADSAIGVYRKLTGEKPDRALYRYHFALALAQKGETAQARQQCEVALKSKPAKGEEAEIRALMAKLG